MRRMYGMKKVGAIVLSAVMLTGVVPGIMPETGRVQAAEPASSMGAKASDSLKLWYDESAVATPSEIYAKKFRFMTGDGFLEFGRTDKQNWEDGVDHSGQSSLQYEVTQAVKDGVAWAKHGLPIGNGHMGAMTFGYLDTERVQMNEDTLWTGGPNCMDKMKAGNDADAYGNVSLANPASKMETLVNNAFTNFYHGLETGAMPTDYNVSPYSNGLTPNSRDQEGAYQSFCEMFIDFDQVESKAVDYSRELDLNTAVSSVKYDYNGVSYDRSMFASYPDDVMVYKISASEAGKVFFTLHPEIPHMDIYQGRYNQTANNGADQYGKEGSVVASGDSITLSGTLNHNGMKFAGSFKVVTSGGSIEAANDENNVTAKPDKDNGRLEVSGADEAYIIISLKTDYTSDFFKGYSTGETLDELSASLQKKVNDAAALGYSRLYENHEKDYRVLFDRVKLEIGADVPGETTDTLLREYIENYRDEGDTEDYSKYLETLYYQYGRYLMIACSRDNSLPANLQGVWNDTDSPAWSADYHTNINVQMNYWPTGSANIAETAKSLVNYANALRTPGRLSLAKLYGIGYNSDESQIDLTSEDGFVFFCNTTPLGFTGNINSNASFTQTATAFLGQNLYDYYAFTKDKEYLKSDIFPFLRESCVTYLQTLQAGRSEGDKDRLYIVPSWSSEQTDSPWTVGTYFDQQLVWQLFHDTIQAMKDLGVTAAVHMEDEGTDTYIHNDSKLLARLEDALPRLKPVEVGEGGQIKEWQQETRYNLSAKNIPIGEPNHRHISQLIALYPGNYISKDNTELMNAAKVVLTNRTDVSTGWGLAFRLNLWARTGDGNHSYKLVNALLGSATYPNLFDTHAPFQIDGNFGATAGITEMLLQSSNDKIEILPALPDAWSSGSVEGLVARGNFTVDVKWKDMQALEADITSNVGGEMVIDKDGINLDKITDSTGAAVEFTKNAAGDYVVSTTKGETYQLFAEGYIPEPTATPAPTAVPTAEPHKLLLGDVNLDGKLNLLDAQQALKAALGITHLTDDKFLAADADKNNKIDLNDACLILRASLNIIVLK